MDENQIIAAVCTHLTKTGYEVSQRLHTTQHGVDIIAHNAISGVTLFIEAKGGTSSRDGSARFGREYTQSQVFDRVAKGVFTSLELRATHPEQKSDVVLAVPDSNHFRRYLTPVSEQLKDAGITVMLVAPDQSVSSL